MESFCGILESIKKQGLFRSLEPSRARGKFIERGDRKYYNFTTNDYLGVSSDLDLQKEFLASLGGGEFLMSAVSSRLLGGDNPAFGALERSFEGLFAAAGARKSCLLFNGGYHANTAVLPALASSGDAVFCDRLVHASLIDALRLSGARFFRYAHNDCAHLEALLRQNRAKFARAFILTESVFSMDGDCADIAELVRLKKTYDALLYVDEAHSFGALGKEGLGVCADSGLAGDVDFIMFTLGKAVASQGAVVATSPELRGLLVNRARPFVFTTAMPPICALWSAFVFEKIRAMDARRGHLAEISRRLRGSLGGLEVLGSTHIAPVVVGSSQAATEISRRLLERGYCAGAVRYPTVPKNSARIRISLNAKMEDAEIDAFADCLKELLQNEN